jgi:hypothetical protein
MRAVGQRLPLLLLVVIPSIILAQEVAPANPAPVNNTDTIEAPAVDLRPNFERFGLAPRLQGDRPTCSVFTIAAALEFTVAKRQTHTPRLSVEFLNWAADQVRGDTADGGFFSDLWKGFTVHGICADGDMPYASKLDPKRIPSAAALADAKTRLTFGIQLHWIKEWNVNTGLSGDQITAIKHTLALGWPVCGGLRWPKQEKWVENVLQMCPSDSVYDGHSVLLVGYRDDPAQLGGGVFLFRNTSGSGQDAAMPYGYAGEYMNDAAWIDYVQRTGQRRSPAAASMAPIFSDPLGVLMTPPAGRNRRISSNEQPKWNDANLDMTVLPPGKTLEMPVLEGPGIITHIWFTSHAGRVNELNALSLRIYWDGRNEPGVEVPLGEFFAVGQGKPATVESVPVQVSPSGALSCYWRMPFAKSARIVVANDNPNRTTGLYWQVDWVELSDLPSETPYFNAQYREEYPAVAGRDYLIADLEGTGKYIGTVMSVTLAQDGWWGEGDDFFYVDGEAVPSLQGTGSEDYFNDAWGFRARTSHWFGQPRWQGDHAGDSGVCYRWHVLDPVAFSKSLKVAIEHKGNRAEDIEGFYLERPDFINSIAFWYQTGVPKRFGTLPPYPERCVPWQTHHLVQAFRQAKVSGNTKVRVETSGMFGARPVLSWANSKPGARLSVPFQVERNGRYAVRLTGGSAPGCGRYDIQLDGKNVLKFADFRSAEEEELDLELGTHDLGTGQHMLSFVELPSGAGAPQPMTIELLRLLPLPPEATRTVKTHHEAHFIRLGIGRAVYAYRLIYGEVPDSLQALVKADLMSPRYLSDENGKPLSSHRDGDVLVVESAGVEPWTYRWQGLDARR